MRPPGVSPARRGGERVVRRIVAVVFAFSLLIVAAPIASADTHFPRQTNDVDRPPVSPDGTSAGALTDFVITFIDRDPAVDGIGLKSGGTVTITLPDGFVDTGDGTENTVILLQGWPQSPPFPFPWTTTVAGNTLTTTLTSDYLVGDFGPGFKQAHLLLNSFRNPGPGRYDIDVVVQPDPASTATLHATARVQIIGEARPSVNAVSVFSGGGPPPPFNNPLFQSVAPGDDSLDVGLYLWEAGSSVVDGIVNPFVGVDIEMTSRNEGRLVQGAAVVGHVSVDAPAGAEDFGLSTDGPSVLGSAVVTGLDVGILVMRLHTDPDVIGEYVVRLAMAHGNSQTIRVTAE